MFKKLGDLRAHTKVPFMALTATTSESSAKVISESLHLCDPVIVSHSLNRPFFFSVGKILGLKVSQQSSTPPEIMLMNLYSLIQKDLDCIASKLSANDVNTIPKTIIFVQTKTIACRVYSFLKSASVSHPERVDMYHASLTESNKGDVRRLFSGESSLRYLVATIAFGMVSRYYADTNNYALNDLWQGMDVPDVTVVVVYGVPKNMSQLYQVINFNYCVQSQFVSNFIYL